MTLLMCIWLCIVMLILVELEVFSRSKFVGFGPRPELNFMHVTIDTYYKYNILVSMIVVHTFITDLIADSLVPHVLNFVQVGTFLPLFWAYMLIYAYRRTPRTSISPTRHMHIMLLPVHGLSTAPSLNYLSFS